MKTFAIVLLSHGTFGGAQRRFTHLFLHLRKDPALRVYFFVTPLMKKQILEMYGPEAIQHVISVGPESSPVAPPALHTAPKQQAKAAPAKSRGFRQWLIYKLYYYLKTRRAQYKLFTEIKKAADENGIDRFLAVYTGVLPLYFYLNQKGKKPRIVFSNMDSWFSHLSSTPEKDWYREYDLFNRAHKECDQVDVLSPFILQGLKQRGITLAENRCSITACSFTDYSRCVAGNKSSFSVVFAARLEKDKNPLDFTEAALALATEFPQTQFHIAGEGRLSNQIKETLEKHQHPNIFFHGFLENPINLFAGSSLFVSLQSENNYPSQAVLEAMACGNAVIATNVGDTRMFVNEENGYLIPRGTPALIAQLRHCLTHTAEAEAKGQFAKTYVRSQFSIDRAAKYYLDLLYPENTSQQKNKR